MGSEEDGKRDAAAEPNAQGTVEKEAEKDPVDSEEDAVPSGPSVILGAMDSLVDWLVGVVDWGAGLVNAKPIVNKIAKPLFGWAQRSSLFALHSGIACCAMEMGVVGMPRLDSERLGVVWFASPRRCDVLLVNGWITKKMRPVLRTLYDQMPAPKWVIAMGECAISGGPWHDSYNVVYGADEVVPVDIYIPGCPPRPEALLDALCKLQKKIEMEGTTSGLRVG